MECFEGHFPLPGIAGLQPAVCARAGNALGQPVYQTNTSPPHLRSLCFLLFKISPSSPSLPPTFPLFPSFPSVNIQLMQADTYNSMGSMGRNISKTVRALIIITGAVSVIQYIVGEQGNRAFEDIFALSIPGMKHFYFWQPVTYIFLHSGLWHFLFNMLGLFFFGSELDDTLGSRKFLGLYFGTGILGGIGWLIISIFTNPYAACIGASGAVYGIVGCFAAMFPHRTLTLLLFFVIPVTLTARTLALGIIAISAVLMITGGGNVAHSAHLFGCLAGYLYGMRIARNPGLLDSHLYREGNPITHWISDMRARARRRKMKVIYNQTIPPTQEEVDAILDKISEKGIDSLSKKEKDVLSRASGNSEQ